MVVLGIDPGLERIGWGVVERCGSQMKALAFGLVTTPKGPTPERLAMIHAELTGILEKHGPDAVCTEKLFFAKNQTTAIDVAKALGVIQLVISHSGLPCMEFSPPEVKSAIVGNGAAEKKQVQYMVQKLLGLAQPPRPDDVADALAIALTYALRSSAVRGLGQT
ncbi:MAG: crossover junction endodeoxyribonuclease RuvC [Armatimonadetes bacterium]|nr:crossover junction endodeoxyribonuclease RuvC [Armatimonadota bacterium]